MRELFYILIVVESIHMLKFIELYTRRKRK